MPRRGLPHRITLIYSNRTLEGAPFHAELTSLARNHATFAYVPTITEADKSPLPWEGERRLVNADFLHDHVGDMTAPIFYLVGPPWGPPWPTPRPCLTQAQIPRTSCPKSFPAMRVARSAATIAAAETALPKTGFVKVAQHGNLAPGQVVAVAANGAQIALCNVDGVYYAVDDTCPHRSASLAEGDLIGKEITCPLHGAIFDVTTGEVLEGPAGENLSCYRGRLSGSDIEVEAANLRLD